MRRGLLLAIVAIGLGVGAAPYLAHQFAFRHALGQFVRRGELVALVGTAGIYDIDLDRAWQGELFATGAEPGEIAAATAAEEKRAVLARLIAEAKVTAAARGEEVSEGAVRHEMELLRDQFPDEKRWALALQGGGTSRWWLQRAVARNLRARSWIEQQIAGRMQPNDEECRRYFEKHRGDFQSPARLRASHLFLAAPDGYPEEVITSKRTLIDALSKRLANGEPFPALVAQYSEDEATKKRAGDLGYFAAKRMLPEVWEAASKLQPGEISPPLRSRLGFHILRLIEALPARTLTFEEARPEIVTILENQKRLVAVADLRAR